MHSFTNFANMCMDLYVISFEGFVGTAWTAPVITWVEERSPYHSIPQEKRGKLEEGGGCSFKTHGFLLLFGLKAAASEVRDALDVS